MTSAAKFRETGQANSGEGGDAKGQSCKRHHPGETAQLFQNQCSRPFPYFSGYAKQQCDGKTVREH